jgi:hypothetical protein
MKALVCLAFCLFCIFDTTVYFDVPKPARAAHGRWYHLIPGGGIALSLKVLHLSRETPALRPSTVRHWT